MGAASQTANAGSKSTAAREATPRQPRAAPRARARACAPGGRRLPLPLPWPAPPVRSWRHNRLAVELSSGSTPLEIKSSDRCYSAPRNGASRHARSALAPRQTSQLHQKLALKETATALTKCHHFGGMYSMSPASSTHSQYGADAYRGKRVASGASASTWLLLVCRPAAWGYSAAECAGLTRRTYLRPTTCASRLWYGSWWNGVTVPAGPSHALTLLRPPSPRLQ
ncbi:MAG: hypothetical protein J3K34DRAFT_402822 [Monoraphidium minutum]|nr:MAG: hypothetical protein J3K34DRAFT_402822 [Monoraphidium minutum]